MTRGKGGRAASACVVALGACAAATAASAAYSVDTLPFNVSDNLQQRQGFGCADEGAVAISGGILGGGSYADGTYVSESTPGIPGPWLLLGVDRPDRQLRRRGGQQRRLRQRHLRHRG